MISEEDRKRIEKQAGMYLVELPDNYKLYSNIHFIEGAEYENTISQSRESLLKEEVERLKKERDELKKQMLIDVDQIEKQKDSIQENELQIAKYKNCWQQAMKQIAGYNKAFQELEHKNRELIEKLTFYEKNTSIH